MENLATTVTWTLKKKNLNLREISRPENGMSIINKTPFAHWCYAPISTGVFIVLYARAVRYGRGYRRGIWIHNINNIMSLMLIVLLPTPHELNSNDK